jgi:hypothetical protein
MAIEKKDLLDLLGIEEDENTTLDDLKAKFHDSWASVKLVPTDERFIKPIVGKALGSINTALQRSFKSTGIDLADEEIKDKRVEEIIEIGFGKVGGRIKDLDEKAKAGSDTKAKKYEEELAALQKKYAEKDTLYNTVKGEFETKEKEWDGQFKSFKLNQKIADAKSRLTFGESVDPLRKRGFEAEFWEKYKTELDDTDNVAVYDAKTGQRVTTDNKKDYASFEQIFAKEAEVAGLLKKNDANKNTTSFQRAAPEARTTTTKETGDTSRGRRRAPSLSYNDR